MGLDSVELLIDVENAFQIIITDPEAEKIATVGDFYELILKKIDFSKNYQCQSQILFYKLREVISRHCRVERKGITPSTELSTLFSETTIKERWATIQDEVYFKLPGLKRSKKLLFVLNWSSFILICLAIIAVIVAFNSSNFVLILYAISFIVITYLSWIFTRNMKKHPRYKNMRDLVQGILPLNIKHLDLSIRDKNDVLHILKYLIHDKTGVELDEITLEANIVNDLGLN